MSLLIAVAALAFLMFVAYRAFSVILFAPIAALFAVLLTDPSGVPTVYTGLFMDKMVAFVKLYFPIFLLGAVFGKVVELSGFARSIVSAVIRLLAPQRAMLSIVLVGAILTYGGVSLFVVVFAVYPFAAEKFRQSDIPKRLIPGTIALTEYLFRKLRRLRHFFGERYRTHRVAHHGAFGAARSQSIGDRQLQYVYDRPASVG